MQVRQRIISTSSLKPSKKPVSSPPERISFSKVAHTTIQTEGLRGLDEMTCSYSFEDNGNQQDKELFSKFLQADQMDWLFIFATMSENAPSDLVSFVKIGETSESIYSNRIISHYIGVWFQSMSYHEKQTRQRVISNVFLYFNENSSVEEVAGLMYDNLFQGYLPEKMQLKCLLETCKRGWEFFSFLTCRLIKVIKRVGSLPGNALLAELQKAIQEQINQGK